ncbi:gluzincin family metallopeptidase [Paenibacillus tianjinensis]|uniref:Peptidase MA-like domain-containing protein n=1 Tax=Paenibacillus tianjinensis TaxID=2810347 RepID=A0ABX7LBR4_9BACL|nr:hypothetical protein [Paenibacillus tianjinensis]QSF44233.1 hypothetical protein JRJ22_23930 [Paenibacillus tianjinensis]
MLWRNNLNILTDNLIFINQLQNFDVLNESILYIRFLFGFRSKVWIKWFDSVEELQRYVGVPIPSWVIGTIYGKDILIVNYERWKHKNIGTLEELIIHEFSHIVLHSKLRSSCPLWLDEGLAVYLSGQINNFALDAFNHVKTDVYNLNYDDEVFYISSAKAVKKLVDSFGVNSIIDRMLILESFENDAIFGRQQVKALLER